MAPGIQQIAATLLDQVHPPLLLDLIDAYAFPLPLTVLIALPILTALALRQLA